MRATGTSLTLIYTSKPLFFEKLKLNLKFWGFSIIPFNSTYRNLSITAYSLHSCSKYIFFQCISNCFTSFYHFFSKKSILTSKYEAVLLLISTKLDFSLMRLSITFNFIRIAWAYYHFKKEFLFFGKIFSKCTTVRRRRRFDESGR